MPWWGWLITCVVVFILAAWTTTAVFGYRQYRKVERKIFDDFPD